MSSFSVDTELLLDLVDRMTKCHAGLEQIDDEVDNRMKQLHATWQGEVARLHAEAHQRWITGSRQMAESLKVLRGIARTADENYSAAVRANQQMWAQ